MKDKLHLRPEGLNEILGLKTKLVVGRLLVFTFFAIVATKFKSSNLRTITIRFIDYLLIL